MVDRWDNGLPSLPQSPPYLDSGSAIECERLDLPILKENLQHIRNKEKCFFLQHLLGDERAPPPTSPGAAEAATGHRVVKKGEEDKREKVCQLLCAGPSIFS